MVIRLSIKSLVLILSSLALIICSTVILPKEIKSVNGTVNSEAISLPVIMYHHLTQKSSREGKYTLMAEQFRKDMEYLKDNGYETVDTKSLTEYTDGKSDLPEKPIMITFDDGFESFYVLATPILEEMEMKASVFVIGYLADEYTRLNDHNINYSYLTWDEIYELDKSPLIEVHSHTYNLHQNTKGKRKGIARLKGESATNYEKEISADLKKMQKKLKSEAGVTDKAVAYPYGLYSKSTAGIIKKLGYRLSFTCEERINTIIRNDKNSLFNLGRYNRPAGISSEEFFNRILK